MRSVISYYIILGLRADDLHMEENPDVENAIKRLPEEDQYLRIFRIKRAMDLTLKHQILPKEEWTTPEEVMNIQILMYCKYFFGNCYQAVGNI